MFDGIKDYAPGLRVLSGSVSNPRLLGSVLGLGWDKHRRGPGRGAGGQAGGVDRAGR
ncbi:hypothetical protein [Kutzneria kofuensis]|uniref:hypothetical protein n=1 Tax=Kutzneria kofuensis TaxID=103725 RepID=UPI0031E935DF